jgi:hypothetical protein
MTSVATVCGHFPLTLVSGPGAAARNSIGLVLVGGMSIGTLFTLFVVPALYVLIARDHRAAPAKDLSFDETPEGANGNGNGNGAHGGHGGHGGHGDGHPVPSGTPPVGTEVLA